MIPAVLVTNDVGDNVKGPPEEIDGKKAEAAINFLKRHDAGWSGGPVPETGRELFLDELAVSYIDTVGLLRQSGWQSLTEPDQSVHKR